MAEEHLRRLIAATEERSIYWLATKSFCYFALGEFDKAKNYLLECAQISGNRELAEAAEIIFNHDNMMRVKLFLFEGGNVRETILENAPYRFKGASTRVVESEGKIDESIMRKLGNQLRLVPGISSTMLVATLTKQVKDARIFNKKEKRLILTYLTIERGGPYWMVLGLAEAITKL